MSQPPDEPYTSPSYTSAYQPSSYQPEPAPPPVSYQPTAYQPTAYQPTAYQPSTAYQAPAEPQPPPAYQPSAYVPGTVQRRRRPGRVAVIAAGVAVLLGLVGVAVTAGALTRTSAHPGPTAPPANPPPPTPVASTTEPTPTDVPSSTAPPSPTRPVAPADALALTDQQAVDELTLEADEAGTTMAPLQGSWVPQVSSKCVGIAVDIGPNWFPDGTDDTPHVTIQQVLAFHLSLRGRFGAVTVRPTQVGVRNDRATSGPCSGQVIWMSVVPQSFGTAAAANGWCAANLLPVKECAARYVAGPGQQSTLVLRG